MSSTPKYDVSYYSKLYSDWRPYGVAYDEQELVSKLACLSAMTTPERVQVERTATKGYLPPEIYVRDSNRDFVYFSPVPVVKKSALEI